MAAAAVVRHPGPFAVFGATAASRPAAAAAALLWFGCFAMMEGAGAGAAPAG